MTYSFDYYDIVAGYARDRKNQRFPNGKPEHAAFIIEKLFENSKQQVRIFNGCLNKKVFEDKNLVRAAIAFLARRESRLDILLQNSVPDLAVNPFVTAIFDNVQKGVLEKGKVSIRNATGAFAQEDNHFTVNDTGGFRFEIDDAAQRAIANFNEPDTAEDLINRFDAAFREGQEVAGLVF